MKRLAVLAAALVAIGTCASAALAAPGNGNGARTAHFTSIYTDFTCHGERIATSGPQGVVKDEEECMVANAASFFLPAGLYTGSQYYVWNGMTFYWRSDYDNQLATSVTYIVSQPRPDGTAHLKVIAYY